MTAVRVSIPLINSILKIILNRWLNRMWKSGTQRMYSLTSSSVLLDRLTE